VIFYETINGAGLKQLAPTQADARAIDRSFVQVDLPTDKAGYMGYVNRLLARISELENQIGGSAPAVAPEATPNREEVTPAVAPGMAEEPPVRPDPEPAVPIEDQITHFGPTELAPVVERAVERLAELDEDGVVALNMHQSLQGVGVSFSRGVHMLSVVAAGEHQLGLLLRSKKTGRKWGQ
jgi:hypothetical protein